MGGYKPNWWHRKRQSSSEIALISDLKGDLNLGQFRENPVDYDVIKKCRRQAFFNKKIGK